MSALSERDMRLLAFERGTWRTAGAKEQAIVEVLGISATTADRHWAYARAWLNEVLSQAADPAQD